MSGFDPDWLALRAPADTRSRDRRLIRAAARSLAAEAAPLVCDLGAGTGAAMRAFASDFPADTRWLLVDDDDACLAEARRLASRAVDTRVVDLVTAPAPWPAACALVTATALFDLASAAWIETFVARLAASRLPLLSSLTFDGQIDFFPSNAGDAAIRAAFLAHQRTDKGLGGPAAGPEAATTLGAALQSAGYWVEAASSPWLLSRAGDGALIDATLAGIAQAAVETGRLSAADGDAWLARRVGSLDRLVIGHEDLYATPGADLSL